MTYIRAMTVADVSQVTAIEQASQLTPWSERNFTDALAEGYFAEVSVEMTEQVLGFCLVQPGVEEVHLLNVCVRPDCRRKGIARNLLQRAVQRAKQMGKKQLWLEVRASNTSAIALYQGLGMQQVGRRPGYYQRPGANAEDALLFTLYLDMP